jgi:hypothetical protein
MYFTFTRNAIIGFKEISNVRLLDQKLGTIKTRFDFSSYKNLNLSIDEMTNEILPLWEEDSIPLTSLSGKAHYVRDLIFLKACHSKNK